MVYVMWRSDPQVISAEAIQKRVSNRQTIPPKCDLDWMSIIIDDASPIFQGWTYENIVFSKHRYDYKHKYNYVHVSFGV